MNFYGIVEGKLMNEKVKIIKYSMKTAEEIMNEHFKECFETHNEKVSEKYILYFHKAFEQCLHQNQMQAHPQPF